MFGLFSSDKTKGAVLQRIERDEETRLRQRYDIWYRTPERQEGARVWVDGREMLMMASNDYLGLGEHPKVIAAAKAAMEKWGTSTTGARLANGSRSYHLDFEAKLATFLGKEACHVSAAGYISCMSTAATFATRGDVIVVDRNVHSSLWAGIQLSNARYERFAHNDATDLANVLEAEPESVPILLVIEGVYSMEGHICPLPELLEVAKARGSFVILDDAHGFGVMGAGRGTAAHFGKSEDVDIICGSLSKALSSTGGFVAGSRATIEYLRTHSKQTIFSAALSPAQTAAASAALDVLQEEPEHIERLWDNTRYCKGLLDSLGIDTWASQTPAMPIVIGKRERAYEVWKKLWDEGFFTVLAISPAVPPGRDLIRTAVSARHRHEDFDRFAEALSKALGTRRK
ncbi:MAG: pyridoxal phosphate-dependent aminotransferase family protein [Opitutales bacterium]|nr:pyridoxal phosphate-dependent aminotransferase family protein [Opitutales bacterium]